jgi:hypothetical protein
VLKSATSSTLITPGPKLSCNVLPLFQNKALILAVLKLCILYHQYLLSILDKNVCAGLLPFI